MESSTTPKVIDEPEYAHSGVIRWEVEKVSQITHLCRYSPSFDAAKMPWKLRLRKNVSDDKEYLVVEIACTTSDSKLRSVDFDAKFTLFNKDSSKNESNELKKTAANVVHGWSVLYFIRWKLIINPEKGFIKDDKITVEVQLMLYNIMGIRKTPRIDFTNKNDPRHDISLVIEGERIYASKQILACNSPVFNAMFYGEFAERNMSEIVLKGVDRRDFVEMLYVLYSVCAKITGSNAEYLLKLGYRFRMNAVIDQVEQFLFGSTYHTIPVKLILADQYGLYKLEDHCLGSFKTTQDIARFKTTEEFKILSHRFKSELLEKVVKLI